MSVFAAALKMKAGPSNGKLYTEEDWNTDSGPDKEGGYMYSKVQCLLLVKLSGICNGHTQAQCFVME